MKKTMLSVLALSGIMAVSLCACGESASAGEFEFAPTGEEKTTVSELTTYTGLSSAESVYAMGAVTTTSFIAPDSVSTVSSLSSRKTVSLTDETDPATDDSAAKSDAENFNTYLEKIETFLNEDQLKTVVEENTDEAYADYEIKMTVIGKDIGGADVEHVLYYTETFTKTDSKDKNGEVTEKTQYSLNGVMVMGETDYTVRGERKEETVEDREGSETKSSIQIRAYADPDDFKSFVQMAYESETESENGESEAEHEYVYTVIRDGRLIEKTSVKYETEEEENGEQETKYTIFFYGAETGAQNVYSIEREYDENGRETLKVFYLILNGAGNGGSENGGWNVWNGNYGANVEQGFYYVVKDENGDYVYTFLDGSVKHFRAHK